MMSSGFVRDACATQVSGNCGTFRLGRSVQQTLSHQLNLLDTATDACFGSAPRSTQEFLLFVAQHHSCGYCRKSDLLSSGNGCVRVNHRRFLPLGGTSPRTRLDLSHSSLSILPSLSVCSMLSSTRMPINSN